jgi:hypothetical protein
MTFQTVNFKRLIELLLPTFLRQRIMLQFLGSTIKPLQKLHDDLIYKMQHNCSVIYLEKVLNEFYEVPGYSHQNHETTRTIYILDEYQPPDNYIYLENEPNPTIDYNEEDLWLDEDDVWLEEDDVYHDFVVYIPSSYVVDLPKLKILIDYYKLAGKKYRIQFY